MTAVNVDSILGAEFLEGGRDPATGIDCLGTVEWVLERLEIPYEDPWDRLKRIWENGWRDIAQEIPVGWRLLEDGEGPQDGDLVIWTGHIAVMLDGWVVSAAHRVGVYRSTLERCRRDHPEAQLWRYE